MDSMKQKTNKKHYLKFNYSRGLIIEIDMHINIIIWKLLHK